MKKTLVAISMILGLGAMTANAQNISFGAKADANLSNYILQDLDGLKSKLNFGGSIGAFTKFEITDNFAIQPELLAHYKNTKMEEGNFDSNIESWSLEIPVYALGPWNAGSGKFYAGVGPYVSVGLGAKSFPGDVDLYKKVNDESQLRRWDFGGGALVGYEFANHVQINAGYKIGFLNMMDSGRDDAKMLNQTLSLGVGYRF